MSPSIGREIHRTDVRPRSASHHPDERQRQPGERSVARQRETAVATTGGLEAALDSDGRRPGRYPDLIAMDGGLQNQDGPLL